jgi:hypothetical protein
MLGQDSEVDKRNVMLGAPKGNCPGSTEEMLDEKFGDGGVHAIAAPVPCFQAALRTNRQSKDALSVHAMLLG